MYIVTVTCSCRSIQYPVSAKRECVDQVLDLSHISPELAYAAEDADLVVMEGMVRNLVVLILLFFHVRFSKLHV